MIFSIGYQGDKLPLKLRHLHATRKSVLNPRLAD